MRRPNGVFFTFICCLGCSGRASLAERRPAVSTEVRRHVVDPGGPEPAPLTTLARAAGPKQPVRILHPANGSEIEPGRAAELSVRVHGPVAAENPQVSLALSLDGARPRPVVGQSANVADLLDPGVALTPGVHDLVLALVGPDGVALDPRGGGVAASRFFVGPRPSAPVPPRLVCLAPFGTVYGSTAKIALDFVAVSATPEVPSGLWPIEEAMDVLVTIESPSGDIAAPGTKSRQAAAGGPGPFLLGDFESGDHRVTLARVPGAPAVLPGSCVFTRHHELEPP